MRRGQLWGTAGGVWRSVLVRGSSPAAGPGRRGCWNVRSQTESEGGWQTRLVSLAAWDKESGFHSTTVGTKGTRVADLIYVLKRRLAMD